ncbi:MAG: heavy-metal-associated domain-containing protein [Dehalococcoidia bacterium]|nr:heavy-metal-associated domain-containing protein [Dehalococcoidia bacterium]MCA9825591.1 heavy-metal-associated domain-containing protein [Dehalococcoidia bacterium]MCA9844858.1 heavy-metal-associated domain-containing protein [Dehalococcoidia bacterium]MCA9852185.1 heavy-metal-associated domain-containing protein [Dehalococcoidia bacterium]
MAEEIVLNVEGMTCDHCVNAVKGALEGVPGVASATVNLEAKEARVAGEVADKATLIAAIKEEGYEAAIA